MCVCVCSSNLHLKRVLRAQLPISPAAPVLKRPLPQGCAWVCVQQQLAPQAHAQSAAPHLTSRASFEAPTASRVCVCVCAAAICTSSACSERSSPSHRLHRPQAAGARPPWRLALCRAAMCHPAPSPLRVCVGGGGVQQRSVTLVAQPQDPGGTATGPWWHSHRTLVAQPQDPSGTATGPWWHSHRTLVAQPQDRHGLKARITWPRWLARRMRDLNAAKAGGGLEASFGQPIRTLPHPRTLG